MLQHLPIFAAVLLLSTAAVTTNPDPMSQAAVQFKNSLTKEQRKELCLPFLGDERANWSVLPYGEAGVRFSALHKEPREALMVLLSTALSKEGLRTVSMVRELDRILVTREAAAGQSSKFHGPERYFVTLYGDPTGLDPWGWRFEGHHLSLNVTHKNGAWTSIAPFYVGSQPAHVQEGEYKGLRLVGPEDDLARDLYKSLSAKQQARATLSGPQPGNVVMLPKRKAIDDRGGIPWAELHEDQRKNLTDIVDLWIGRRSEDLATVREKHLLETQLEKLSFGWSGSPEPDAGHYWRIFGAGLTVEHSAPAADPNHVHTLWRDEHDHLGR